MRICLTVCILILCISLTSAQSSHTLVISNLDKTKGALYIAWYNKADDFRKADKAVYSKIVPVEDKDAVAVKFEGIANGTYAVAIFFDKNGNGKIDTNMFGIPKEKYGFSNNVYPMMRAATFNESAFVVNSSDASQTIRLK